MKKHHIAPSPLGESWGEGYAYKSTNRWNGFQIFDSRF